MLALAWLIPVTLALGGAGLAAYLWTVRSGQYEDLDAAAWRILEDGRPAGQPGGRPDDGSGPARRPGA